MTLLLKRPVEVVKPAGQFCPLCGSVGKPWGEKDGYPLRECCGILLSWQFASVGEYEAQYTGAYHTTVQQQQGQPPSLTRDTEHLTAARCRLELLRQWVPPPATLLDVGCGAGSFVAQAQAFGYDAMGFDPCFDIGEFGRRLGRNIFTRGWRDVEDHAEENIITLHDVLEHLTEPQACLELLRRRLRPKGLIVVEMPEFQAPGDWVRHIRPLQHVALYSDPAARELFRRCGLQVEASFRPCRGTLGKASYWLSTSTSTS